MFEPELVGVNFLLPLGFEKPQSGYLDRATFCRSLSEHGVIGQHDSEGHFSVDWALTDRYRAVIPDLAEALTRDPRDPLYRKYKLAALEKVTLDVRFEWEVAEFLHAPIVGLHFCRLLRDISGATSVLVDLGGPSYEVLFPDTVEAAIEGLISAAREHKPE